jgi:hypothetical protein
LNYGPLRPVLASVPRVKKLQIEACEERFAETQAFIAKAKAALKSSGPSQSPE